MPNTTLDLNNPDTRQEILLERLKQGTILVARDIAQEFAVSADTIRRDLIALENKGLLKRVKGGAMPLNSPVQPPTIPMAQRLREQSDWLKSGVTKNPEIFSDLISDTSTLFLDGGTSVLFFARQLPHRFTGLVITPSPLVAAVALEKEIETVLIGGKIRPLGGIATGAETVRGLLECTANLVVLGACGIDPRFGLSADDLEEAAVKQAMAKQADKVVVLAGKDKVNTRSRHKVLPCSDIDILITSAPRQETAIYDLSEIEVRHV